MKRALIIIILIAGLLGCAEGKDIDETFSIEGTWEYSYMGCTETYTFNAGGSFQITSNNEIQGGTYNYEETVMKGDRHELAIIILSDNLGLDCAGSTSDDTGISGSMYLEFNSSGTTSMWYDYPSGGTLIFTMTKL